MQVLPLHKYTHRAVHHEEQPLPSYQPGTVLVHCLYIQEHRGCPEEQGGRHDDWAWSLELEWRAKSLAWHCHQLQRKTVAYLHLIYSCWLRQLGNAGKQ